MKSGTARTLAGTSRCLSAFQAATPQMRFCARPDCLRRFEPRPRQRADAGIVEHHLVRLGLRGLAQAAIELENIGDVLADVVAGAVAADDDVFHGDSPVRP